MGYIGSKSAITKLSQLENDIGYKKCKGTVKEFMVSSGRFNGVTWLTYPNKEYPVFKVPTQTSEVDNDAGFGPGKFLDIKQNVLKSTSPPYEEEIVSTLDPTDSSTANIKVPTSQTQLYNSAGYTTNKGTVEKLTVTIDNSIKMWEYLSNPLTLTGANISFKMVNDITKLQNYGDYQNPTSKLITSDAFKDYFKYIQLTTKDNTYFKFTDDVVTSVNFYFIRYGKIRILHGGIVRPTVGGSNQRNSVLIATIKNNEDKPNTYSDSDLNHSHYVGYGTSERNSADATFNVKGAISIDSSATNINMLCWNDGDSTTTYNFYIHAEWLAR